MVILGLVDDNLQLNTFFAGLGERLMVDGSLCITSGNPVVAWFNVQYLSSRSAVGYCYWFKPSHRFIAVVGRYRVES